MKAVEAFDPTPCCSGGVPDPDVDQAHVGLAADVERVEGGSTGVERSSVSCRDAGDPRSAGPSGPMLGPAQLLQPGRDDLDVVRPATAPAVLQRPGRHRQDLDHLRQRDRVNH